MTIQYPIFVRDRNGEVIRFDSDYDVKGQLEAIDVEDGEYESWDSAAQILTMRAHGIGVWDPGRFEIHGTGKNEDPVRFQEVKAAAKSYRPPFQQAEGVLKRFFKKSS